MSRLARTIAVAALLLVMGTVASVAQEGDQCGVCHPEARVQAAESVHSREGVTCVGCHGGDGTALETERAHRGGFSDLSDRAQVPAMCAGCHSDLEKMRPYNLPVDQYAVYQTSQHGRALAAGELRAAVCTDCHGVHNIRGPQSPDSLVHHRNVPETCGRCHADRALTERFDLDPNVVSDYRQSVHGRALLEAGNLAAPDCTSCHGVHGATPPGFGDVDKVCGACHVETRAAFLEGPHRQGMLEAELPECASCHSNHLIRRLEAVDLDALCADCHGEGSDEAVLGKKIHSLIVTAEEEIAEAEALVSRAAKIPLDVEDPLSRLEEAKTHLTEAFPLAHTVSLQAVERPTRRARSIGEEVQAELYSKMDNSSRHIGLAVFWFYVLMTLAVLVGYRRRLKAE